MYSRVNKLINRKFFFAYQNFHLAYDVIHALKRISQNIFSLPSIRLRWVWKIVIKTLFLENPDSVVLSAWKTAHALPSLMLTTKTKTFSVNLSNPSTPTTVSELKKSESTGVDRLCPNDPRPLSPRSKELLPRRRLRKCRLCCFIILYKTRFIKNSMLTY